MEYGEIWLYDDVLIHQILMQLYVVRLNIFLQGTNITAFTPVNMRVNKP